MRPPDLIEILPAKLRTEAVFGVVAVARAAVTNPVGHDQTLTVDLRPPADRPAHSKAAVQEFVGPETRFGSIVEGNADHSGAAVTLYPDRAQLHVKVHGDGFAGAPGKFKAVYRLPWVPDPPAPSTTVPDVRETRSRHRRCTSRRRRAGPHPHPIECRRRHLGQTPDTRRRPKRRRGQRGHPPTPSRFAVLMGVSSP
jgi:hypothetical protein